MYEHFFILRSNINNSGPQPASFIGKPKALCQHDWDTYDLSSRGPNNSTCPPSLFYHPNKSHTTIIFIIPHTTHYLHQAPISNAIKNQPIQTEAKPISPSLTKPTHTTSIAKQPQPNLHPPC